MSVSPKKPPTLSRPDGLRIGKKGDALETIRTNGGILRLLVAGDMEIVEGTLHAGERLTLLPETEGGSVALEAYYILSGRLSRVSGNDRSGELVGGDYLITRGLGEEVIFTALEEIRFLYFSSRPFFHEISGKLQELMQLAVEVEVADGYTAEHCVRLQRLSFATGQELGLDSHRLRLLDRGAYLHDVGKVRVPREILQKPGSLTDEEWSVVKKHPSFGRELLEPTFIRAAGPIVEQHHERMDGSGYPFGLVGDEILPESYIVAIVDTYDAMTTDRVYRKALPVEAAEEELKRFADVHYPRDLVEAFLSTLTRLEPKQRHR